MADGENGPSGPPSGAWRGYYLYLPTGQPHPQQMRMGFLNGCLEGEGVDDIGLFSLSGEYLTSSGIVSWAKKYANAHVVNYRGYYERGVIWGTWRISGDCHGGFKIWPLGHDSADLVADAIAASLLSVLTQHAEADGITLQEAFNQLCRHAGENTEDST